MRAKLKRHNRVYRFSSKHSYWPMRARVVAQLFYNTIYYMALSHKDWELPNSRIWLAKTDIDRGLDFPI